MFAAVARQGRLILLAGLLVGAGLPTLAQAMLPFVPALVACLLFLNAFRSGDRITASLSQRLRQDIPVILFLQLVLPLASVWVFSVFGQPMPGFGFAVALLLAAPSLTGSPNFVAMAGRDPTDTMRLLVLGTLLFPLTAFIVLQVLPVAAGGAALTATLRLAAVILAVVITGVVLRRYVARHFDGPTLEQNCEGVSALLLGIVVVGLMAEVGPTLRVAPDLLGLWLAAAFGLNIGLQISALILFRALNLHNALGASVVAGNRNIGLFLLALSPEDIGPAMIFIGVYQIPMYLTPILMRRLHRA
jgi:hypothetical protein